MIMDAVWIFLVPVIIFSILESHVAYSRLPLPPGFKVKQNEGREGKVTS